MKKKPYLPTKEADRVIWINNFNDKIGTYAGTFNITAAELLVIAAMALIYTYMITLIAASRSFTKSLTKFKNVLSIAPNGTTLGVIPVFTPPVAPALTQAGIFTYIASIVARIKSNTASYTPTIGDDLRIIGEETIFVPDDYQANGKAKSMPGFVVIEFEKPHVEGMDIYSLPVGTSDLNFFEKIGTANHSPFHDTRPLLAAGKPENRYYKTRAIIHDEEIGHPSEVFTAIFNG